MGIEWGAADDDAADNDDDIIAGIKIKETENGVFVYLSSDSVDDNEEESSELSDTNVSYDFKTEVTVE